ncbi:LuxR C-terminal-related transcriptional regulator [Mycobacterium sp. CVI_P3]|uniref:LuxR C-terminal-related transcriptional regulator n=1 Tax=Mycobacterium pinniadriaticum TaxID=2994102 RepID=A0ABT3SH40_9MYCO|nr:LuxR C-terminal-related transcriptional regulator [Mycobacterium pinniadriaticum]MCX2932375.1 LuxR C-terminal-related transcriptional regulator [Mycobacterium pinniadriaticum]MCX2938768.1 LuxR C-terminal-related transcriptional regulator [Mycobacterium pinniadriaticum]
MQGRDARTGKAGDEEGLRAVLDGLRSVADTSDPRWRLNPADARAIVDGAWAALADLLDDKSQAGTVLQLLRRLTLADDALVRSARAPRMLGEALKRLESAPSTVAELVNLGPRLIGHLGFDRGIFSRIVDGVWTSEAAYVVDDVTWAEEINRVGQERPQPLVPGLPETEMVRRRESMIVTDVQRDPRVHRPIAEASRSNSYVAAPIISGNRVVGLLHGDCYIQGRDPDSADREALSTYATALQLALGRARVAEQLRAVGDELRNVANGCLDGGASAREFTLGQPSSEHRTDFPRATRVTMQATSSVRGLLTAREGQILELMADGLTNSKIAEQLVISEGTVKQHVKHVLRKLRAGNRVEAVSMLYQSDRA